MGDDHGPAVGEDFKYATGLTTAGENGVGEEGQEKEWTKGKIRGTRSKRFSLASCTFCPLSLAHLFQFPVPIPPPPFLPLAPPSQRRTSSSRSTAGMSSRRRSSPSESRRREREKKKKKERIDDAIRAVASFIPTTRLRRPPLSRSPLSNSFLLLFLSSGCSSTSSCSSCRCRS